MKKITDSKVIKILNGFDLKPDQSWIIKTRDRLGTIKNNMVSTNTISRNIFNNLADVFTIRIKKILATTTLVFIGIGAITTVTVMAAQNSRPGDPLYGLEKSFENVQRVFTQGTDAKANLEVELLHERIDELNELKSDNSDKESEALEETLEQQDRVEKELEDENEDEESVKEYGEYEKQLQGYLTELPKTGDSNREDVEEVKN